MFLLLRTNHIHRIHTHTILHNLKMQVETCAVAGIAYITYNLPCRYRLYFLNRFQLVYRKLALKESRSSR